MSANTDYYWNKLQDAEKNAVGEYKSQYGTQIQDTLNKIVNRQAFSYDFNADPLYQNYKDQYTKLGNEAAMNAVANASALSGGYGNSYAVTAGAQANQQYLTQLNQVIPELYNAAMSKYQMEGDQLNNMYATLTDAENTNYNKYRDQVNDYNTNLSYLQNAYNTQLSNDQWQADYDYQQQKAAEEAAYQAERDRIADEQWNQQYALSKQKYENDLAYQKERDAVADAQWQAEYALKQASQAASAAASTASRYSGGGSSSSSSSTPTKSNNTSTSKAQQAQSSNDVYASALEKYRQVSTQTGAHEQAEYAVSELLADAVNKGSISAQAARQMLSKIIK